MKHRENNEPRELLDGALNALRETPVPPGPPDQTLRAVLAAGQSSRQVRPRTLTRRILAMNRIAKIAAAVVVVAIGAGLLIWLPVGSATVVWADVQEKVRNVRTMSFTMTLRQKGEPGTPAMEIHVMMMEPGLMRQDIAKPERVVTITDLQAGKILVLADKEKKAVRMDLSGLPEKVRKQHKDSNFLAKMKKLVEKSETELGEKEIDGRTVKGYKVTDRGEGMILWVDAETAVPVEMEFTAFGGQMTFVMSDFEFDQPLDEDLFSLDVPEGYTLMKQTLKLAAGSAEDVVEFLRIWAGARGGTFPDTLTPAAILKDREELDNAEKDMPDEESLKLAQFSAGMFMLLHLNKTAHYAGKGVKLGDADTAIFWYKPKGAETYKVIYGDLTIKDVAEEDLPATQPAEGEAPAPGP